eukprot:5512567-Ditylum_brightwellii.AAC.1
MEKVLESVELVYHKKYAVLDNIIQAELVPALFGADGVPAEFNQFFTLPVKHVWISMLSPMAECSMNHQTLLASTSHLVGGILQEHELNLQEYNWVINKGKMDGELCKD